ncbi:MAG TPA: DUF1540 domain-containing protein [Clostridia bacterium]|nr:DUF1540 domain-containing protein [Clostridia bacterium]
MATDVHCTINNCKWWKMGNVCGASQILVTSDEIGEQYPDSVDVDQVSMLVEETGGGTPAGTCMHTCCKTFHAEQKMT